MKYLIYGRYKNYPDYKFLSTVADNKAEGISLMGEYPRCGIIAEMVPAKNILADCKNTEQKICKILNELGLDEGTFEMREKHFSVEITGDWKHDHIHADNVIKKLFGAIPISEDVTQEDGTDFYSSIHTYCL